jgi:hypothetical protein
LRRRKAGREAESNSERRLKQIRAEYLIDKGVKELKSTVGSKD